MVSCPRRFHRCRQLRAGWVACGLLAGTACVADWADAAGPASSALASGSAATAPVAAWWESDLLRAADDWTTPAAPGAVAPSGLGRDAIPVSYDSCDDLACDDVLGCGDGLGCGGGVADAGAHRLTGDWFGVRSDLERNKLLQVDLPLTQFYQGNTTGGRAREFEYGGKMDYFFTAVGGLVVMHAETRFGEDVIFEAVPAAPVNANMLMPDLSHTSAITGLVINLPLTEAQDWIFSFGKINALDNWNLIYPQSGRGVDGFMNVSNILPLTLARTVPLSYLGASVIKLKDERVQAAFSVLDTNNIPTTSGFSDLFDNGATLLGYYRIATRHGGHAVLGTWSSGDFVSLNANGWLFIPEQGLVVPQASNPWSAQYIIDQHLWKDPRNPQRNVYFYNQFGIADQETGPAEWVWSGTLEAQGWNSRRPLDRAGVGLFYTGLSSDLQTLVSPLVTYDDAFGGEAYYNAAVTPWFRLTADLQVIEPAASRFDTAVVVGLRAKTDF